MAKAKPFITELSGKVGREIHYTRFGREYVRHVPTHYNDRKSEAQLRVRELFKTRQRVSALLGIILQRGLTTEAHKAGMIETCYFSRLNNNLFVYEDGKVYVDYPALLVAKGPLPEVEITGFQHEGLHIDVTFIPNLDHSKASRDDVVHFYAVSPQADFCDLMASVMRVSGHASFDLPDLSDDPDYTEPPVFYIYAITESNVTAGTPTLSADEKQANKRHRNIDRKVSRSVFVGTIKIHR